MKKKGLKNGNNKRLFNKGFKKVPKKHKKIEAKKTQKGATIKGTERATKNGPKKCNW